MSKSALVAATRTQTLKEPKNPKEEITQYKASELSHTPRRACKHNTPAKPPTPKPKDVRSVEAQLKAQQHMTYIWLKTVSSVL